MHLRLGAYYLVAICLGLAGCGSKSSGHIQGGAGGGSSLMSGGGQSGTSGAIGGTGGSMTILGSATGGGSAGQGGSSSGNGGSTGGFANDAGGSDAQGSTSDASSAETPSDRAPSVDALSDGSADAVHSCRGYVPVPTYGRCRTNDDCKSGSDHCLRPGETDACPIPPYMVPCPAPACTSNKDCTTGPGGTCVSYVIDYCPRCDGWQCQYPPPPPPPCTKSPDSCSAGMRCRSDGACEPVPCGEGYACASDSRCSVGSSRADGHGCELIPCGQGFACEENTRCTAPTDPSSHGCTTLPCKADGDCDCGFCVWGSCSTSLGTCSNAA
jgi:hypothetical protein